MLSDLREFMVVNEINPQNTAEVAKLGFFIEQASSWIKEYLGMGDVGLKMRTQYYNGLGTQRITLRNRPVFPAINTPQQITVLLDENGNYGSTSGSFNPGQTTLQYGTDYCLQIDQDNGSSRSAILIRINDLWYRPTRRVTGLLTPYLGDDTGSIQVTYYAGWTVDTIPALLRLACNTLVARLRYFFPLAMELGSESYEDRSIGMVTERKDFLMALVKPMLNTHRNYKW